ncbi:MAG: type II toxin-antitoxin system VapC family toxin [Deltaproteobacteria bacterium]|nr:type II toxin-antitoxin system VapC family toxin [Deltaproteobacteria bacterium]
MTEIPDASVAIKWFVREGETGLEAADEVHGRVVVSADRFAVPTLFVYEVAATLCRRIALENDLKTNLRLLWALAIPAVAPDEALMALAAEIAFKHRVSGYDAAYIALAVHLRGTWLTFDAEAFRRVRSLGVARLLR